MLCSKPSIKDAVSLPQRRDSPVSFSNDPLSPRISCIGQVKRENKVASFPTSQSHRLSFTTKSNITSPIVKYSKLKKFFSSKNLSTPTIANTAPSSCGSKPPVKVNSVPINIENMDPPLPVIKRVRKLEEESQVDSLWKRRSGGATLKGLQLQQIHHTSV